MPADMKGKVVIVTGGATGMGREAAKEFASVGARVAVVTGHNAAGGRETVSQIRQAGGEAEFFQCDVTKEEQVQAMVEAVAAHYGRVDCAFNNAGVGPDGVRIPYGPLTELTEEIWDKVMNVNLKGLFFCLKHELLQRAEDGPQFRRLRPFQSGRDRPDQAGRSGKRPGGYPGERHLPRPHHRHRPDEQHPGHRPQ